MSRNATTTASIAIIIALSLVPGVWAITITPSTTTIDEYATPQDLIITFYNDQFSPIGCQPTIDARASYLSEYVTITPARFLLDHDEQVNVHVKTAFPENLPPQRHELVIRAYEGAEAAATISFRPPGEQRVSLAVRSLSVDESERGESLTLSFELANTGNTVLFVKPEIVIEQEGRKVKNTTYQHEFVILPQTTFPLTLRQDNTDLPPGAYTGAVRALYKADGNTLITDDESFSFTLQAPKEEEKTKFSLALLIIVMLGAFVVAVPLTVLLVKRSRTEEREERVVKRERHIMSDDWEEEWREVRSLREELTSLTKEVELFSREVELYVQREQ